MQEVTFGYRDLKKLECDVSSYECDLRQLCVVALKKELALMEKWDAKILRN